MATIQIVPQSRSGMLFMLLLYTSFVRPFCLCPSFPPNITKHGFSWRFQLGSGMMSSCPALCGHHKDILPGASSEGELGLLNSLFMLPQGNPLLICPSPCLSWGSEMLAFDCDWDRWMPFKVPWRNERQAYSGGLSPALSPVECGGLPSFGK